MLVWKCEGVVRIWLCMQYGRADTYPLDRGSWLGHGSGCDNRPCPYLGHELFPLLFLGFQQRGGRAHVVLAAAQRRLGLRLLPTHLLQLGHLVNRKCRRSRHEGG